MNSILCFIGVKSEVDMLFSWLALSAAVVAIVGPNRSLEHGMHFHFDDNVSRFRLRRSISIVSKHASC